MRISKYRYFILFLSGLGLLNLANSGTVAVLSASGGGSFNETITIHTAVNANEKIQNSNFYFEIRAPDGTVVDTHSASPPTLELGESFSYSWNSTNSSYPAMGNYSISLCWSPGSSMNCQLTGGAAVTTTFYSVPTFGSVLTGLGFILIGGWFWYVRKQLTKSQEPTL